MTDSENLCESKKFRLNEINSFLTNLDTNMNSNNQIDQKPEKSLSTSNPKKSKNSILYLEIISSSYESAGKMIKITPDGMENSHRKKKTEGGVAFFGYVENDNDSTPIDYIIKPREEVVDDRFIGQHFQIKYNPGDYQYYIKDLGNGFGTFIKIVDWIEVKNNFLLSIGENYIVITIGIDNDLLLNENNSNLIKNDNSENLINLKVFSGNIRHGSFSFNSDKKSFVIGRAAECDICIDDGMLSRFHCTFEFREGKWFLKDGKIEGDKDKKSTNGTWIYAYEDILIKQGLIFKANHNLFICSIENE